MEWIKCSDQFPQKGGEILIINEFNEPILVHWIATSALGWPCFVEVNSDKEYKIGQIKYWMPLPKPPKSER